MFVVLVFVASWFVALGRLCVAKRMLRWLLRVRAFSECTQDTGAEIAHVQPISVANVLLQFLHSLVDPLIPTFLHQKCNGCASLAEAQQLLQQLPIVNFKTFHYLTAFLQKVVLEGEYAPPTVWKLAMNFASAVFALRESTSSADDRSVLLETDRAAKTKFMRFFLQSELPAQ